MNSSDLFISPEPPQMVPIHHPVSFSPDSFSYRGLTVLLPIGGGVGYQLWRGSRWVPLLGAMGAIALCHCWGAIAGCHAGVPLLGTIAGVPLLDASYQLRRSSRWVPLLGAMLGCHCEKKLTRVLHRSPLHLSLH